MEFIVEKLYLYLFHFLNCELGFPKSQDFLETKGSDVLTLYINDLNFLASFVT